MKLKLNMNSLPPAGTKVSPGTILAASISQFMNQSSHFKTELESRYKFPVYLFATGRTAMLVTFLALKSLFPPEKNEVIIPAYTCYSVAASIKAAGLKIKVVDIIPSTLDINFEQLKSIDLKNTMAIVSSNLFGLPNNLKKLRSFAKKNHLFFIDDAAQAMGATIGKSFAGLFGDVGIFSLDKGKNITTMNGGVLVVRNQKLIPAIEKMYHQLKTQSKTSQLMELVKLLTYSFFLRPQIYGIPDSLPFLGLGRTIYTEKIPMFHYNPLMNKMGLIMINRLEKINSLRREKAKLWIRKLNTLENVINIELIPESNPVFLRLPILIKNKRKRNKLMEIFNQRGLGVTTFYPGTICDIKEIADEIIVPQGGIPGAEFIADHLITLPTHEYVTTNHMNQVLSVINSI